MWYIVIQLTCANKPLLIIDIAEDLNCLLFDEST
jgi:hypothetical protein